MGIKSITTNVAGQIADEPRRVMIVTSDALATVTTTGYLNRKNLMGYTIYPTDIIDMFYSYVSPASPGTFGMFTADVTNGGIITLNAWENPGNVLLPVVDGDFANFNGTSGQVEDAGFSPTDATKTKVVMLNAAPTINHVAIFTNANGTIGDGGVLGTAAAKAASNNALSTVASTAGSGFTAGHVVTAADAAGTIQDSGIAASAFQLSANIKSNSTADIGGGGAGPISVVVAGLTAASKIVATIASSTNTVAVGKCIATATGFDITFTGDPGAACVVNYVAFVVAQ